MKVKHVNLEDLSLGEKRQYILVKKLLIDLEGNLNDFTEINLLNNILKIGLIEELIVKAFLTTLNVDFDENTKFTDLIGKKFLDGVLKENYNCHLPYKVELKKMYKQRNQAQHGGVLPNATELHGWFSILKKFILKVFAIIFDIDFMEVNLASLIKNPDRKNLYNSFINMLENESWKEALSYGSKLYLRLMEHYKQVNYFFLFEVYCNIKMAADIENEMATKISRLFELLPSRDFYSAFNINEEIHRKLATNSIRIETETDLSIEELKKEVLSLNTRLVDLLIRLDSNNVSSDFNQDIFIINDLEYPVQYMKGHYNETEGFILHFTGIINNLENFNVLRNYTEDTDISLKYTSYKIPDIANLNVFATDYEMLDLSEETVFRYYVTIKSSNNS